MLHFQLTYFPYSQSFNLAVYVLIWIYFMHNAGMVQVLDISQPCGKGSAVFGHSGDKTVVC